MGYKIAVVGATGNVGREILSILEARGFPADEIVPLASSRSKGKEVSYGDKRTLKCEDLAEYDFTGTHIALFSPGSSVSKVYAPKAAEAGCIVIDNTSHFRMDEDVPLVVPEVNAHALSNIPRNIIANPNCSTIQMVVALQALEEIAPIKRVVVSTYQSVSGGGKEAMDELYNQTKALYMNEHTDPNKFTKRIAFNVIPHIDVFMENGSTKEEWKMEQETKKIMGAEIPVHANCARVPVFVGHSEYVNVEFEDPIDMGDLEEKLHESEGIVVEDRREDGGYTSPIEATGEDAVYISRIRRDNTVPHGISFWCVSDNLRKGAALNAVQIAEKLVEMNAIKAAA